MPLEVLVPGPATTIQDLGRPGFGAYGVAEGGAMDRGLLASANRLVGNRAGAPALEFALQGPRLRWLGRARVRCVVAADGMREVTLGPGEELGEATLSRRAYGYIAVAGEFDVPLLMGGRGTCLPGGFGGFEGRELRAGDRLPVGAPRGARTPRAGAPRGVGLPPTAGAATSVAAGMVTARVLPGDRPRARSASFHAIIEAEWRAGAANRVGLRLVGPALAEPPLHLSQPIPPGAVQVTGAGQPILLLRDHPTIGGYPVVAVVVAADIDLCAQLRPGARLRFRRA